MALRVLEWLSRPGSLLPEPLLQDDADTLPSDIVRGVRKWLQQKEPEFQGQGPTPQLLELSNITPARVTFLDTRRGTPVIPEIQRASGRCMEFEAGTFQVMLKSKKLQTILLRYDYLGARDVRTGAVVIGPLLRVTNPDGSIAR